MRTGLAATLALALLLMLAPALQAADKAPDKPDDGFDPAKVETRAGIVKKLTTIPQAKHNGYVGPGLNMTVTCGDEDLNVPLGPKWFLDAARLTLKEGDQIVLKGMRLHPKRPYFLVSEIKNGPTTARFRDENGVLYWKRPPIIVQGASAPRRDTTRPLRRSLRR